MHVKSDALAFPSVVMPFQNAYLIKRAPQVDASKWFVLVKLETVLIVEMDGPELAEGKRELQLIRGIQTG